MFTRVGPGKSAYQTKLEFLVTFSELCSISFMSDGAVLPELPIQNAGSSLW